MREPAPGGRVAIEIRVLSPSEESVLADMAPEVFDYPVDARWSHEFFSDPRHHLAVALDAGRVVGMASGIHYVHPDKQPELWVNEVGVAPSHQGQGIGKRLLTALFERGQSLGCAEAWVLTSQNNEAAQRLYRSAGGKEMAERPVMFTFRIGDDGATATTDGSGDRTAAESQALQDR